ncbi:hypothetical protein DQ384_36575 [Sphaerisporangium album]|uniref:Uncharacterized protein n=1 Tax=Sphaerisporangium album TaxID=509200 RepID=A0A367ET12_9ACTN|nr:hypothetical protein DQ384_36575 [Sphaerisporangium album]
MDKKTSERVRVASVTGEDPCEGSCWCGFGVSETSVDRARTAIEDHREDPEAEGGHDDQRVVWWV